MSDHKLRLLYVQTFKGRQACQAYDHAVAVVTIGETDYVLEAEYRWLTPVGQYKHTLVKSTAMHEEGVWRNTEAKKRLN